MESVIIRECLSGSFQNGCQNPGIYTRPKINELIGEVMPTTEEVAQCIAKRYKIKLVPSGSRTTRLKSIKGA